MTDTERERQALARTLHDTVCQDLTGLNMMVSAAARRLRGSGPEVERELREIAEVVQRINEGLKDLLRTLDPEG